MEAFNFVVFGFTSNLAQLKIIPALYDLEAKNLLAKKTKIVGIGRKDIDAQNFIVEVLATPNRHHQHPIDPGILKRLQEKCSYIREDFEKDDGSIYKTLQNYSGNSLFYLATYPDLYCGIFENLKKYGLNKNHGGWTKIMIEKPIGHDLRSARDLNRLLGLYFDQDRIFRVDHYLGKEDLQNVFAEKIASKDVDSIQLSVTEDFGIGKRGVYYDATGALIDMGQNHFMQMLSALTKDTLTVDARERVIDSLVSEERSLVFGQYEGYLAEEKVKPDSLTDTFFALKTHLSKGTWQGVPIYMRSGKDLKASEVKISVIYKNGKVRSWVITSTGVGKKYDPYEKLILEAVNGNQLYFNSAGEVEASWKFIDDLVASRIKPVIYKPGSWGPEDADTLIQKDGRHWV